MPAGEGPHIYVRLTREGKTTRALVQKLRRLFNLAGTAVGCAGLKDKHARVTQTFSLLLPDADQEQVAQRIQESLPAEVHWVRRHRNKLKTGHLRGNRFRIKVLDPGPEALGQTRAIAQALEARGLPNYFGQQRFGVAGDNAQRGREILLGGSGPRRRWERRFLLYAYQSALFNTWLAERIRRGWFEQLLSGDIALKLRTGGRFEVKNAAAELTSFRKQELTYTGPVYGQRMRWASGLPGSLEREVLEASGIMAEMLQRERLDGNRRPARLFVNDLHFEPCPQGIRFDFYLPKGAYATTVLREFTKAEPGSIAE